MNGTIASIAACLCLSAPVAAQARPIDFPDLRRIVSVSEPQLSPDGRHVAFMKSVRNFDKDRNDSQLMLLDVATGITRPLTFDRRGVDTPRWSPSGDRLAFVANSGDGDDVESQIFVMPMNGGDPKQITKTSNGVQEFEWRPDGKAFAFVTQDDAPNKAAIAKHIDAFSVGDLDYKFEAGAVPSHLWLIAADGGTARRLTSGSWSLSTVNAGGGTAVSWAHDGKTIAITKLPNAVSGDSDPAVVALVDVRTGKVTEVPGQRPYETGPLLSPSGGMLAVTWSPHGTFNSNGYIVVMPAKGGQGFEPAHALDHSVDWFDWTADGSALMMGAEDGARNGVWVQPLHGSSRRVELGGVDFSGDANLGKTGSLVFVGSTPASPAELYYLATPAVPVRRLTNFNASIAKLDLGAAREITWTGPGGFKEDGILTVPPGFSPKKKYPLVLVVHGGPQSASQLTFNPLAQLLAARGFLTFNPNYRGSTNLGDAYQHAIYRDTGDGPGKDVMAGVGTLEKMGFVDETRMAVTGWSYGGYMTTWLESHYDVWKCAMAGAALTDWVADYTISFYQKGDADFFGGGSSPWTKAGWAIWRDQSPIAFAGHVKAPTLIMGDVGDPNVPIYNSYQWYHALRDNGVAVQFVAFPRDSHFPGDPVGAEDVDRRWVDWVQKYLR